MYYVYFSAHQYIETHNMTYRLRSLDKKFIRCSIRVLVAHLTALIRQKLDVPTNLQVQFTWGKFAVFPVVWSNNLCLFMQL